MQPRPSKLLPAAVLLGLILVLTGGAIPAQQPLPVLPPPGTRPAAQPEQPNPDEPEVLARGPVHEAFATTAEAPVAAPVVSKQPPDPIEELPPDQKPEGDNVQWLPGYWHWDDDADQYIWISGFWRNTPPGRVWVPGSWREVRGGWQWVAGFWQEAAPPQQQQQVQPEIQYLPQPPQTVEVGPAVPAPTVTSFYVPGSWVWRGRFLWRPGFWIEHRPNWVWVPAHYRWTPLGHVFVDGYWDYTLAERGVLFAPVYFPRPIYTRPAFVYTPAYVVSEPCMVGALFVRRGWGCYFFGDYFAPRFTTIGFNAWCGTVGSGGGFSIGFGVGRTWGYDPLWAHYSVAYRNNPGWAVGVGTLYGGRFRGDIPRPPVNLVQQNTVINNITNVNVRNVTNNVTVVNKNVRVNNTNVTDVAMLAPVKVAKDLQPEAKMRAINAQTRKAEADNARQIREVAVQRRKLEVEAAAKPVGKGAEPRSLKLDVPKTVVARSVVKDEKKGPPANPNRDIKAATKVDPKVADLKPDLNPVFDPKTNPRIDPKVNPKIEPKGKFDPKVDPKLDPKGKTDPKLDPKGKIDPKGKTDPMPKGKFDPKFDPKGKIDPKGKTELVPNFDPKIGPKVDPKGKVDPVLKGKADPPTVAFPKGKTDPKVDTKGKVEPPPVVLPKGKIDPAVDPKGKDPRGTDPKEKTDPPATGGAGLRTRLPAVAPNPVPRVGPVVNNPVPAKQPAVTPKSVTLPKSNPVTLPPVVLPKVNPQSKFNPVPRSKVNPQPVVQPKLPATQPRVVQPRSTPQQKGPVPKSGTAPKQRDKNRG